MNQIDTTNIVYTLDEVAFIFRISKRKLRHLIKTQEIKTISLGPRHTVIPRSEIERFLGQDLRFVDLSGFGTKPKAKKSARNVLRFLKN